MHFEQKKLLYNKTFFDFGEEELSYRIEGERQAVAFKTPYTEIDAKKSMERFAEKSVYYAGLSITAASIAMLAFLQAYAGENEHWHICAVASSLLLLFGFALRMWGRHKAKFEATKISVSSGGKLIIFHDGQQKTICDEIHTRRLESYKRKYGQVDALNHPEAELKKFLWLKEHNIITAQEFADARQKIAETAQTPHGIY